MAQTIKLKRSANATLTSGQGIPTTSNLELGEVAINTYHGKMYIKKNDGSESIVEVGAADNTKLPLTGGTITGTVVFNSAPTFNTAIAMGSTLNVASSVGIAGTTVIDASRNLTNIGTISSGGITATSSDNDQLHLKGTDTDPTAIIMDYNGTAATDRIRIYNNAGSFQFLTENGNQKLSIDKTTGNATFAGNITVPNTSTIAGATIRSSGINASNSHLQLGNAFPWIDLVAPDGAYFKAGITARGGASSTQGQFHLHIARDSSYKKLSSAGNYDTYLVTETANTVYGNLILKIY